MRALLGLLMHQSFVTANHGDVRERQNSTIGDSSRAAHLIAECVLFVSMFRPGRLVCLHSLPSGRSERSVAAIEKHCS